jgi:hypothetical protein
LKRLLRRSTNSGAGKRTGRHGDGETGTPTSGDTGTRRWGDGDTDKRRRGDTKMGRWGHGDTVMGRESRKVKETCSLQLADQGNANSCGSAASLTESLRLSGTTCDLVFGGYASSGGIASRSLSIAGKAKPFRKGDGQAARPLFYWCCTPYYVLDYVSPCLPVAVSLRLPVPPCREVTR